MAGRRPQERLPRPSASSSTAPAARSSTGRFAETRELVVGFSIWEVKDMDEAMAWAARSPTIPGSQGRDGNPAVLRGGGFWPILSRPRSSPRRVVTGREGSSASLRPHYANTGSNRKLYRRHQPEPKRSDMRALHRVALKAMPGCMLWFLDGKDRDGKTVSNPNIGYGLHTIKYAGGKNKRVLPDWYQRKHNRNLRLYPWY